jgi:hypothetical protein
VAIEHGLGELARRMPRITAFGITGRVPELMAAADVAEILPGATTCSGAPHAAPVCRRIGIYANEGPG